MTVVTATQFKAHCLSLMERVRKTRKPVLITKRGRAIAQLVPPPEEQTAPWRRLRGSVSRMGDVIAPVVSDTEIQALR
jgi:prevent-host-death family protein